MIVPLLGQLIIHDNASVSPRSTSFDQEVNIIKPVPSSLIVKLWLTATGASL